MADSAAAPKPTSSVKLVLLGEAAVGKSSLVLRFVNNDFQENKEPTIGAAFLTQKCALSNRTIKFEIWDTAGQERFASLAPMYYRNAQAALVVYDLTKASSLTKAQHWVAELQRQASPGIVIALVGNKYDLTHAASRGESSSGVSSTTRRPSAAKSSKSSDGDNADNDEDNDAERANDDDPDGADADGVNDDDEDEATESDDPRKITTKQAKSYADAEGLLFFETSAKTGMNVTEVFSAIASAIPESQLNKGTGRGGANAGGRGGGGAGGNSVGETRIDLGSRDGEARKDGCAC